MTPDMAPVFPTPPVQVGRWQCGFLDCTDPRRVDDYERRLYEAFEPALAINPLIRDLWIWDDERRLLRTRVPYSDQRVALMTDPDTGSVPVSVGVNLRPDRHWQSGRYGFPAPTAADRACEFLILANGTGRGFNGPSAMRHFVFDFLFRALADLGYRRALATTADHMLWFYRRLRGEIVEQRMYAGHRRTLLHWDLPA